MRVDEASDAFVERVLESRDPKLRRLAATGLAPLPLPVLLDLQVRLTEDDDSEIAKTARDSLAEVDPQIVVSVVDEGAAPRVVRHFALRPSHPVVIESILRQRAVSRELLVEMAPLLEPAQQEILLLRQDAIVEQPAILDALESNGKLSTYARRRAAEYREHLLPRLAFPPAEATDVDLLDDEEESENEEVAAIRAEFVAIEDETPKAELENLWKASELKLRLLPVAVRLKLARGATALLRRILIRDQNPTVALAVLKFSPIKESEIERVALSRVVVDEVLAFISNSKTWCRRYKIVHSLCQNPRTPVSVGVKLLPRLSARHLLLLSRNRNVPSAVKGRALRLYRIKVN